MQKLTRAESTRTASARAKINTRRIYAYRIATCKINTRRTNVYRIGACRIHAYRIRACMIYTFRIGTCGVYACRIHWYKLAHANNDSDDKTAYQKRRYFLRANQPGFVMLFFFSFLILLALPRGKRLFGSFVTVKWSADTVRSMEHERLIKGCLCSVY